MYFTVPSTVWFELKLDIVNFAENLFNDNFNSNSTISKVKQMKNRPLIRHVVSKYAIF